jgi:hypothetical protein
LNWKKLPLRNGTIYVQKSRSKKHKGEYRVVVSKGAFIFEREQKPAYFQAKAEVLAFITQEAEKLINGWID